MTALSGWPLRIEGISKYYGSVRALTDVSLSVGPGEFLTILGPSGSGKTTMLKCVTGFEAFEVGSIFLGDVDIGHQPPKARNIGMVFQNYALFPHLTVEQNIAFPLTMRRMAKANIVGKVDEVLRMTGLRDFAGRYPSQLSGGQQQRVALARAVVFGPQLLLLDEPFGALDRKLREMMQLEVRKLQRDMSLTTVFITHDQEEALMMSDRIAVMFDGMVHQVGTPEDIYDRPATVRIAEFVGESNLFRGRVTERLENGRATVDIGTGAVLVVKADASSPPPGAETAVLVRPERIQPTQATSPTVNVMRGCVRDSIYLGTISRYRLETDFGQEIVLRVPSSTPRHHVGDVVEVAFEPESARLLPVLQDGAHSGAAV